VVAEDYRIIPSIAVTCIDLSLFVQWLTQPEMSYRFLRARLSEAGPKLSRDQRERLRQAYELTSTGHWLSAPFRK